MSTPPVSCCTATVRRETRRRMHHSSRAELQTGPKNPKRSNDMKLKKSSCLIALVVCGSLFAASDSPPTKKRTEQAKHPPVATESKQPAVVVESPASAADVQPTAKIVHYGEKDVIPLKT